MRLIFYLPALLFLFSCSSPAPDDPEAEDNSIDGTDTITEFEMNENRLTAVDFNNELTLMQEGILVQIETLFLSDSASVDLNLENTLFELDLNLQSLALMRVPNQGEAFRDATINLMNFYKTELTTGFSDIIPLLRLPSLTKQQQKELADYDQYFVEQEKLWFDTVFVEQDEFAAANNIKLE